MKMIKILQITTVVMFAAVVITGIFVFIFWTEKIEDFGKLVGIIFPMFIAEVVPALIGSPLTEAVRNLTSKNKENKDEN